MIRLKQALRLMHISWVLLKHGLDDAIFATHLFRPVHLLKYLMPGYWLRGKLPNCGTRIRCALEELGPIFVKFGQILSTRRDLLPDEIANELAKLQDQVPPFPGKLAVKIIEQAHNKPLSDIFTDFDETPFASASVAQVHGAQTKDGRSVVVKVLRPGIDIIIDRDVSLLYIIAELAERYWKDGKRLRPKEIVREYEKTIFDELDLIREGANASQLRRNFLNSKELYIPEIDWPNTRKNVLVQERISGIPVSNIEKLKHYNIDFKQLAERGVEIFFTQVFRDNFFHADMHPGNIFVSPSGQYIAVDFGIVGTLSPSDQHYLADNLLAFFNRDYRRVAELHVESGWVPSKTRVDEFESAIRTVSEPIFERPLKDISFGQFLLRLFQTARRFDMEIQPQLVLLQKTLLNIEGLGRQLYPDLDLWTTAKPFLEKWTKQQFGIPALTQKLTTNFPLLAQKIPDIPLLAYDILKRANAGTLQSAWQEKEYAKMRMEIRRANRKTVVTIVACALIISAAILLGLDGGQPTMLGNAPFLTWLLAGLGGLLLLLNLFDE